MSKFEVKIENESMLDRTYLSVTCDGIMWHAIRIDDPVVEIPQIIEVLQCHLATIERDTAVPVQPRTRGKSKLFKEEK